MAVAGGKPKGAAFVTPSVYFGRQFNAVSAFLQVDLEWYNPAVRLAL